MSIGKGGSRNTQAGTQALDAPTQAYLKQIMSAAQGAGASGPSPLIGGATGYNSAAMGAGQNGLAALGGDPNAVNRLMNPYMSQVMAANNAQLANTDKIGTNTINDQATGSGAFGGSRQGVAQGTMLAQNALNTNQMNAGLLSSGYNNAMNQAGMAAGMGFQGAGSNANLGMGGVGNQQQWLMNQLRGGFVMPTGQQYNGSQAGTYMNGKYDAGSAIKGIASMFGGG